MIAIRYRLHLEQPLLVTGLEGDPNTKTAVDYIPGSVMRGVLIERYLASQGRSELDARDPDERRRFLTDATRYLNAYPVIGGRRGLPTPKSLRKQKLDVDRTKSEAEVGTNIYDLSCLGASPRDLAQPKAVSKPFCSIVGKDVALVKPERRISVHTARDPVKGRATAEKGAVFQYNALAAGQSFEGVILVDDETDSKEIEHLLRTPELRLGGARTAGYGRVRVDLIDPDEPPWSEASGALKAKADELRIVCLAPCLVRDAAGTTTLDLGSALASHLGVQLTPIQARTFCQATTVGGFNRKWGLPLCQTQVIAEGSVFTFAWPQTDDDQAVVAKLNHLLESGIGERREDGFGRFAINWQQEAKLELVSANQKPANNFQPPTVTNTDMVTRMASRILRERLDRNLAKVVADLRIIKGVSSDDGTDDGISNSQLSRLRVEVRATLAQHQRESSQPTTSSKSALTGLQEFVKGYKQTARRQLERVRVTNNRRDRLLNWVEALVNNPDTLWQSVDLAQPAAVQIGTVTTVIPNEWATEYMLRLLDGVLAQTTKRNQAAAEMEIEMEAWT